LPNWDQKVLNKKHRMKELNILVKIIKNIWKLYKKLFKKKKRHTRRAHKLFLRNFALHQKILKGHNNNWCKTLLFKWSFSILELRWNNQLVRHQQSCKKIK
jgi:hypothetical protein